MVTGRHYEQKSRTKNSERRHKGIVVSICIANDSFAKVFLSFIFRVRCCNVNVLLHIYEIQMLRQKQWDRCGVASSHLSALNIDGTLKLWLRFYYPMQWLMPNKCNFLFVRIYSCSCFSFFFCNIFKMSAFSLFLAS